MEISAAPWALEVRERALLYFYFLADRTNDRAVGTVLRLCVTVSSSSVICNVMYCG